MVTIRPYVRTNPKTGKPVQVRSHDRKQGAPQTSSVQLAGSDADPFAPVLTDPPVRQTDEVWHVGTLDPYRKGERHSSYEGAGLSVSHHPEEWKQIARLGGYPTWKLKKSGGAFLDAHALTGTERNMVLQWAAENGYAKQQTVWTYTYHDDEMEDDMTFLCASEQDALDEQADNEFGEVNSDMRWVATPKLLQETLQRKSSEPEEALELVLPVYVEHETNFDGVWWEDTLDPERYSAPRAVIVPSKVDSWETG